MLGLQRDQLLTGDLPLLRGPTRLSIACRPVRYRAPSPIHGGARLRSSCVAEASRLRSVPAVVDRPEVVYHSRVTGKEVIAKLKAAGWSLSRIHGSHHILTKDGQAVPVPVHGSRDLGPGLLATIQRQTGVKLK
ncbi:MAG TPA: type II toxin-antitoxin system HicA family toxin [Thermoanaerobaculia bacterium]|nr:type II toxin-antitoxin system HicA family toxin [Thermoanaerobaculia bacterium]